MKRKQRRQRKKSFVFWFPRISAILFSVFTFAFITDDLIKAIYLFPLALEFILSIMVLVVTYLVWNESKKAGFYFILIGLAFAAYSFKRLLLISVIFASVWLVLTGFLFLIESMDSKGKKNLIKKQLREVKEVVS